MTEAMPFLQKYDITFLRPPTIGAGWNIKEPPAHTDKRKESMMCEPLPGAGEWGRTRALHPCCAVAWEHSAPAENGRLCGIKTARQEQDRLAEMGRIK